MDVSVYRYQSARTWLKDAIGERKRTDAEFSIRRFCRATDFGSHALLVMILGGRRKLNLKHAVALARGFNLDSPARVFLQTLIQLDNATTEDEKNLYRLWLNELNPHRELRMVEVEQYHLIADWIHMVILTLAKIEGAEITPENTHALVGGKVSLPEVRTAFARLQELGLLTMQDGRLRPAQTSVTTRDDVSSRGSREYHRQVAGLAGEAVETQSPEEREFQSFALTVPLAKLPLAKDLLRKFRQQFVHLLEAEPGDEVYQCNLHFFRLTRHPSREAPAPRESDLSGPMNSNHSPSLERLSS